MATVSLIQTKLHPPPVTNDLVERPFLIQRLNIGLKHKLTLVSAPAGFGKSTIVLEWCRQVGWPVAWYSLDKNDDDLSIFPSYLLAALQKACQPGQEQQICPVSTSYLQAPQLPALKIIASTLINELSQFTQTCLIVLDDYHLIENPDIHELIRLVLQNLPDRHHLVLITRVDPPLPIPRLRVQQVMTEIRVDNLRFTLSETEAYLRRVLQGDFLQETAVELEKRTEGWVAGLRMAGLSLRARQGSEQLTYARSFKGSQRYVMTYLIDEVLNRQPETVRRFLLQTALLDRFCDALCAAVTGEKLGLCRQILAELDADSLFIVPLDSDHHWFRYHHLFQELLQFRLDMHFDQGEKRSMHHRASHWFASNGYVDEALHHALAAGDDSFAVQLVIDQRHDRLNQQDWRTLERWLKYLPQASIRQNPALILAQAWIAHSQYQLLALPQILQQAQALVDEQQLSAINKEASLTSATTVHKDGYPTTRITSTRRSSLQGEIDTLVSFVWLIKSEMPQTSEAAQNALQRVSPDHNFVYGYAHLSWGIAAYSLGQGKEAIRFLQQQLNIYRHQSTQFTSRVIETLECLYLYAGQIRPLIELSKQRLALAQKANLPIDIGWAHLFLGMAYYEWNELENAQRHYSAATELRHQIHYRVYHDSMVGLAKIQQAEGLHEESRQTAESLLEQTILSANNLVLPESVSFQAKLALRQGDLEGALHWLETTDLTASPWAFITSEIPIFTKIEALIAQRSEASLAEAARLAKGLLAETTQIKQTYRKIELLILLARIYDAQGQTSKSLNMLEQAIQKGKKRGFIRTFVDLGLGCANLFYQLLEKGIEADYLGQILAALNVAESRTTAVTRRGNGRNNRSQGQIQPLTDREQEILSLLQERYTNKEIAQELVIAIGTVKRHTSNIYTKLGANNRHQAVRHAQDLGILPQR